MKETKKNIFKLFFIILGMYFLYIVFNSYIIIKNQFVKVGDLNYVNQVRLDEFSKNLAAKLSVNCEFDKLCEAQNILDFVSNISYKINNGVTRSPKNTVLQGYGDCDDKSNLLISLLKERNIKSYFVLIPNHIFVISSFDKKIAGKKALYLDGIPYYALESTAKNSKIGYDILKFLPQIKAIINPFSNKIIKVKSLDYY